MLAWQLQGPEFKHQYWKKKKDTFIILNNQVQFSDIQNFFNHLNVSYFFLVVVLRFELGRHAIT
jgi:hypothetical protein